MSLRGSAGPVKTIKKFAQAVEFSEPFLTELASRDDRLRYRPVKAPAKTNGEPRLVYSPSREVRAVQTRIVKRFFKNPKVIKWPPHIFGGIHRDALVEGDKRDHVACAQKHCGARSILKLDIRSFFDNITHDMVVDVMMQQLGWGKAPAELLADICTKDGTLPQGGITSSYLALISIYDIEKNIVRNCEYKKLVYTRYVDDITVSSKVHSFNYSPIIKMIDHALTSKGLSINEKKTSSRVSGLEPLIVHGLNVAHKKPTLPKEEVKRIKAVSRQTVLDAHEEGRRTHGFRKRYYRSMGLVNKLSRVGSSTHRSSLGNLKSVHPLPNFSDYKIATNTAHRLREVYYLKRNGVWYWRRFNVLMAKLDLISLENAKWARALRLYMRNHYRPEFKSEK